MKKLIAIAVLLAAASVAIVWAGPAPLDGKTFRGEIKDMEKAQGNPDTFIFADGTFRSTACDAYGYRPAPYTATQQGAVWTFTAETHSPTWGTMTWKGTIKGSVIEGTATRSKDGKVVGEQVFLGANKP
jgi:hypothetical protein